MSKVVLLDFDNTIGYFTCYRQLLSRTFKEGERDLKYAEYFEYLQNNEITVLRPHIVDFLKKITEEKKYLNIDKICIFSRNSSSTIFEWFFNYLFKKHNIRFDYLFQVNNEYTEIKYFSDDSIEMGKKIFPNFSILTEKYQDGYERKTLEGFNTIFGDKQIIFYDDDTSHIMKRENDVLVNVKKFWPLETQRNKIIDLTSRWLDCENDKETKIKKICSSNESTFINTLQRCPLPTVGNWETVEELLYYIISSEEIQIPPKILKLDQGVRVRAIKKSSQGTYNIGDTGVIIDFNQHGHPNIKWDKNGEIITANRSRVEPFLDVKLPEKMEKEIPPQILDIDVKLPEKMEEEILPQILDIDMVDDKEGLREDINILKLKIEQLEKMNVVLELKINGLLSEINLLKNGPSTEKNGGFKKRKQKKTNKRDRHSVSKKTSKR